MVVILIIEGQAGGNLYTNKGGGSNYLCLPNDPDNGKSYAFDNDIHMLTMRYMEQSIRFLDLVSRLDWITYTIKMYHVLYVDVEESLLFS